MEILKHFEKSFNSFNQMSKKFKLFLRYEKQSIQSQMCHDAKTLYQPEWSENKKRNKRLSYIINVNKQRLKWMNDHACKMFEYKT